ncbi:MAG: sigma-70 family RNA polymerase sigma factor [Rubrobacter sp.]|nr:sigma-70 family RNA polymerase sigma factor [Rubrobacter sp.]
MTTSPAIDHLAGYPRLSEDTNQALLRRAKQGDKKAEEKILRHSARLLRHVLRSINCSQPLADDLFQEGQLGIKYAITNYRDDLNVTWTSYAYNCARHKILRALGEPKNTPIPSPSNDQQYPPIPDPDDTPEQSMVRNYNCLLVRENLAVLTPLERSIISYYFGLDGIYKTLTQLARELQVTLDRVRYHRDRGLKRLHQHINSQPHEPALLHV